MASDARFDVTIKAGAAEPLRLEGLDGETTVQQLKQIVESRTGTFARRQKLIHKGKVLSDDVVLATVAKGATGALTLMLLTTSGTTSETRGAAVAAAAAAAAAEARLKRAREPPAAPPPAATTTASSAAAASWRARREVWGRTGVVAYREAGASEGLEREAAEMAAAAAAGGAGAAEAGAAAAAGAEAGAGAAEAGRPTTTADSCSPTRPHHALLFAGLSPVAGPRAADLSSNPRLLRLPPDVFRPPALRASLQSLRLVGCGLTTEGVPWAHLPPGLTALALDANAIDRVPRALSEDGWGGSGGGNGNGGKKFRRLALLTLSRNRITRFDPGALMFLGAGGQVREARAGAGGAEAAGEGADGQGREEEAGAERGGNGNSSTSSNSNTSALRALDVSHNLLEALPWEDMAAGALASLVELDARRNRIRALEPPETGDGGSTGAPLCFNPLSRRMPALRSLRVDSNLVRAPLPDSLFGAGPAAAAAAAAAAPKDGNNNNNDNNDDDEAADALPLSAVPCPSLSVLSLDDNPITAQEMRAAQGWAAFDARRVRAADKRIESGALLARSTFAEGADAAEWERYK